MADVKSFRVTDETAAKFKEICEQIGGNQQTTLARLIDVFEMQASKTTMPANVASRLEDLNGYLTGITRVYMDMVGNLSDCTKVAHEQYSSQLAGKDKVIADLQEKLEELQTALETTKQTAEQTIQQAKAQAAAEVASVKESVQAELTQAHQKIMNLQEQNLDLQGQLLDKQSTSKSVAEKSKKSPTNNAK